MRKRKLNIVYNCNCMDFMKDKPDNYYDLAITDPPYGIERFNKNVESKKMPNFKNKMCEWDRKPNKIYFDQLFRISKNHIIWGMNNFELPLTEYFIVWDKKQPCDNFARCELAWTNIKRPAKIFEYAYWGGMKHSIEINIHPTQKPVALYKWLLTNYAKPGQTIFDSHVGSGSIRIACHDLGFDFEGCEIDKDYWADQEKRYREYISQQELFDKKEIQGLIYENI
jgi:site-specific DNA-methyltransferase (adenine-specific)